MIEGGVKSDKDNISFLINDKEHLNYKSGSGSVSDPDPESPSNSTEPISTIPVSSGANRFFTKNSEDHGLSGGAIAGIVIACAVALIAAFVIAYIIKSGGKRAVDQTVTAPIENSNEIGNSFGQFKVTV